MELKFNDRYVLTGTVAEMCEIVLMLEYQMAPRLTIPKEEATLQVETPEAPMPKVKRPRKPVEIDMGKDMALKAAGWKCQ